MKAGKVYKRFRARNGKTVTLRALKWEDLDEGLSQTFSMFS